MRYSPEFSHSYMRNKQEQLPLDRLLNLTKTIAEAQNKEVSERYGIENLLDGNCRIKMEGYESVYDESELQRIRDNLAKVEQKFGEESRGEDVNRKGFQTEMAITCLLYKMIGERFIITRTTKPDDLGGADNVIVDKETGDAICAFDEVYENSAQETNMEKKSKMVIDLALDGGTTIDFGFEYSEGRLKRGRYENLPMFYLELHTSELEMLMDNMGQDIDEITDSEKEIFNKLLRSVARQFLVLKRQKLPAKVMENLDRFRSSFENVTVRN